MAPLDAIGDRRGELLEHHVSVANRDSVALLDSFIGPKI
jgi:hypothetical protein